MQVANNKLTVLHCYCIDRIEEQHFDPGSCAMWISEPFETKAFWFFGVELRATEARRVRQSQRPEKQRGKNVKSLFSFCLARFSFFIFIPAHTLSFGVVNSKQSSSASFMLHSRTFFFFSPKHKQTNKKNIITFIFLL